MSCLSGSCSRMEASKMLRSFQKTAFRRSVQLMTGGPSHLVLDCVGQSSKGVWKRQRESKPTMSVGYKKTELVASKRTQFTLLGRNGPEANVRFGSLADICSAKGHVRFAPNSDRESGFHANGDVRFTPKADMCGAVANVRYGPKADI